MGAGLSDVIRTRIYVTDISRWREVGAVHAEFFGAVRPAATMVEVAALIEPGLLVEIEADAYVDGVERLKPPSGPGRYGVTFITADDGQPAVQVREPHRLGIR